MSLINIFELHNERDNCRFEFEWSTLHWQNHYRELAYIPNIYYYKLEAWQPIFNILNGTDSMTYALMYMNENDEKGHIPFVSKLLVKYGLGAVKVNFIPCD